MTSMPLEIARFLTQKGIGVYDEVQGTTNPAHNIFIGIMPDGAGIPADLILLNQSAGRQSIQKNTADIQRPGLQVKCRAQYYDDAETRATEINNLLDQYIGLIDATYYNSIRQIQAPFFLEQDDNERIIFCQNFYIDREVKVSHGK